MSTSPITNMTSSNLRDEFDEPPPYTPRPDTSQGETTVEYGPQRPFQPPPRLPPRPTQSPHFLSPHPTGSTYRTGGGGSSLWRQLTEQMDQIANQINTHVTGSNSHYARSSLSPHPTGSSWSTYPGRTHSQAEYTLPSHSSLRPTPPLPPRRPSASSVSLPEDMSDFARDFYASGAGDQRSPSSLDDNSGLQNTSSSPSEERGPTVTPVPGRPLLKGGKLLVYPRGYTCEKCHNTGYKHYDPLHPCKRCWSKYAKPFTGPLAYSYSSPSSSSNTRNINLQQPLPMFPSSRSLTPPPRPASIHSPPTGIPPPPRTWYPNPTTVSGYLAPPPGAVVCQPGDPRIGGSLCWRCNGKGTMSIFIDRISCPVCGGCGRTF